MRWDRERYIAHALFEDTGREMFSELFGPLHILEEEWRSQGASEKEISMQAFDWDYVPVVRTAAKTGAVTGLQERILSDTPEETRGIDYMGRETLLYKKSATIALPVRYPVKGPDDWEKVKGWYAYSDARIDFEKLAGQKKERDEGGLSLLWLPGAFNEPRQLMGEEELCVACYEEPEMLHEMLDTFAATTIKVIENVSEVMPIDCVAFSEDMAGNDGPLFGPNQVREFFYPYYKKVFDAARACGTRLFSQDSDGDISPVMDVLVESGLNCTHPCQPAGGMDIVSLRKKYGKSLCLKGGIDKHVLRKDKAAIRDELEKKIVPELMHGGTVFALDHRIPNGVPIENYRYYVSLGREMLGLPPIAGEGWARMAF
ncbi:MAG: hypothetical protein MJ141_02640 [Clostridia bacterium]|nr:hypothetical protein [Clostridia bacterium]